MLALLHLASLPANEMLVFYELTLTIPGQHRSLASAVNEKEMVGALVQDWGSPSPTLLVTPPLNAWFRASNSQILGTIIYVEPVVTATEKMSHVRKVPGEIETPGKHTTPWARGKGEITIMDDSIIDAGPLYPEDGLRGRSSMNELCCTVCTAVDNRRKFGNGGNGSDAPVNLLVRSTYHRGQPTVEEKRQNGDAPYGDEAHIRIRNLVVSLKKR
ncbi:hypothetical protein DFH08DRAFT_802082 [Mycena albidolilacea]|uniref:Uncharacterized protein n=1 Tax=Mycena albidolilacea TaxID=1033008 RepID=A0AAD7F0L7_9AGAR|nr:hypothetical protein DFH08DRAFT_802082 [Mycena albidolilacea]